MSRKNKILHALYVLIILALIATVITLSVALKRAKEPSESNMQDMEKYRQGKNTAYAFENLNFSKGQIVFLGDSNTDLCHLDDFFADLDLATYNRGVGADTTNEVLGRLKTSVIDIAPSKVVLMIGTNDVNVGSELPDIVDNYKEIIRQIRTALPDCEIYCMSVIPLGEEIKDTVDIYENNLTILSLNVEIKAICDADNSLTYFDLHSLVKDENGLLDVEYTDDGLHLNDAGFAVWSELIKPYL